MKNTKWFLAVAMLAALGVSGCGKSDSTKNAPAVTVTATNESGAPVLDAAKLTAAFPGDVGTEEVVNAINVKDYPLALKMLQNSAKNPKLTPQQKLAVDDAIAALQNLTGGAK